MEKLIPIDEHNKEQFQPEIEEVELQEFVHKIFDDIEQEDIEEELRRYKKWQKNRNFYRGNQRGFWDAKKRTWVVADLDSLTPSEASVLVINNQFRPQVKTLSKEFSRSQTRIRVSPISDSQRSVLAARFADSLLRYYQPKLLPETKRQIEAKYEILCGNAFRYSRYNKEKQSVVINTPVYGEKVLPEYKKSVCSECGHEGEEKHCPQCANIMEETRVPEQTINGITGYNKINSGDPETELVDPIEIKMWAGAKSMASSPYLRRRRFVKGEFLLHAFPFYTPNENAKLSDSAQAQWQFLDTSNAKDSANAIRGLYEYQQLWLEPAYYARKKTAKDTHFMKLVGGKFIKYTIPKGTILSDEFKTGMYVCRVGKDILGYYEEDKNEYWLHIQYDINVDGVWADGLEDAVMNQQIINEYTSLSVENVLYNASPKLVLNPSLINPVSVTNRPKDMILMSDNARKDTEPKNAFAQIGGMSLTTEVMAGIENAKRDMREQTGALLGFNGQGDPNITTATGMSIARDSALALISTPLAIRAEADEKWCWQILKLVKTHWHDKKYKFLLGKYNEAEAEAFKESVLEEEILLFVEPNSWMPQTNFEKLQNLGAYLTAFGLPLGFLNPAVPVVVRNYASQLYNIPFDFDELSPDIRIAQKRLDTAKVLAEHLVPEAMKGASMAAAAGRPEVGQEILYKTSVIISDAMGVEEDLDTHEVFIEQYTKYLKTDEGQNINQILRQAIKATIADHQAFLTTQRAEAAQNAAMMNPQNIQQTAEDSNQFQPQDVAESPFEAKPPNQGITDFSSNADNSDL